MITKSTLENFFKKIRIIAEENYDEFNSVDGQLGDGDLGITISKGLIEINENFSKFEDDLSKIFLLCAQCFTKASSSSFGTLVAISFMTVAKLTKGKSSLDITDLPPIINSVIKEVSARGKSNIGDKTFIDSLNEILVLLLNNDNINGKNIFQATENALIKFKGKECKIGRARMFAEKSKELNDPGMYAIHKLSSAFIK